MIVQLKPRAATDYKYVKLNRKLSQDAEQAELKQSDGKLSFVYLQKGCFWVEIYGRTV